MSLLVVGSVAFDGVESPYGKVARTLGGAATYFSVAAAFFTPVHLVAIVGDDFTDLDAKIFLDRKIDCEGLERAVGKSFFWAGKYTPDMNDRETLTTDLNVFADFNPKLPASYLNAPYLLMGNIQPRLQSGVRSQMKKVRLAGGDTMNFWIKDFREELLATIRSWDFLLINDAEARMLSGQDNLRKAASAILDMGPHTLVIKRGEYGAILFRKNSYFIVPGYLLERVFDPTGAGDCFAGGFIGYLAQQGFDLEGDHVSRGELSRAVIYGSVMGSFCCEQFGVERFRTLQRAEIDARFEEFRTFTSF